ncbi:hypothetical protein GGX14DRAFT_698799 [Mycena pura]|uniref:25S rRNA (uridine-N(3))-methyltransferase BMT5-like domain-containing protein n=1 Tax=Mycena pura TaxID=153505 RepID=A0AAD6VAV5_9AGAR|nr:hypothetical protein GGX14DRAFT_698799 [Mycena pura]
MAKSKKPLKAALQSQQSRLKMKQKASQATQAAELMSKKPGAKGKGKAKESAPPHRRTVPFRATDKILLIGEGNFSFARALVSGAPAELEHLPLKNITATAYDTEQECFEKYPEAPEIVQGLRAAGVEVLFGVDATQLGKVPALKGRRWDKIVWNFPHAGKGITDQDRNILANQLLILGFLRSAAGFLTTGSIPETFNARKRKRPDDEEEDNADDSDRADNQVAAERGSILITLRNVVPYTQWDVPRLAKNPPAPTLNSTPENPPYVLLRSFVFHRTMWKGYEHRMTKGERAHGMGKTGEGGEDRTWEFVLKD